MKVKADLNQTEKQKFQDIKKYYDFRTNADAIRWLINEEHRRIVK